MGSLSPDGLFRKGSNVTSNIRSRQIRPTGATGQNAIVELICQLKLIDHSMT